MGKQIKSDENLFASLVKFCYLKTGFGVDGVDAGRTGNLKASSGILPSRE